MLINLTPHDVTIRTQDGHELTYPPTGPIARVREERTIARVVEGIPFMQVQFCDVQGLPRSLDGVYMIVSSMVRQALPDRLDLVTPGYTIRDQHGQVIACRALYCNG
jgi:hypothetical protein